MSPTQLSAGVHRTDYQFAGGSLGVWEWPCVEIVGENPGPRIAIYAGMHVNEVSSIEAALRLSNAFQPHEVNGRISIIPVLNIPALENRDRHNCPIDQKNINFCFPGDSDGSFSEKLAYAILNDWADDAICLVDMHGGDFGEEVARFNLYQRTGDAEFDAESLALARLFDAQFISALGPEYLERPGRSITYRAAQRRQAVFTEAGIGGIIDEQSVDYHFSGVLRVAAHFGLIGQDRVPVLQNHRPVELFDYVRVTSTSPGWCKMKVTSGDHVEHGQTLATITDYFGEIVERITAPRAGWIQWTDTAPTVNSGQDLLGLGFGQTAT